MASRCLSFALALVLSLSLAVLPACGSRASSTTQSASSSQADASAPEHETVKVLCIGNSWTGRCTRHFGKIAESAGKNAVVGYAFLSKGTLQEQYFALLNGGGTFTLNGKKTKVRPKIEYRKFTGPKKRRFEHGSTLKHALRDEDWDYVILQNRATESAVYSVWDKRAKGNSDALLKGGKRVRFDVNDFVDLMKKTMRSKTAKKVKVGLSAVWSFAKGQPGSASNSVKRYLAQANGGRVPKTQGQWDALYERLYRDIQKTIPKVRRHMGKRCAFIANPGLALHRAEKDPVLSKFGYRLRASRTDAHPAPGIPCYVTTLSYARVTLGIRKGEKLWYPREKTTCYRSGGGGKLVRYTMRADASAAKRALAATM